MEGPSAPNETVGLSEAVEKFIRLHIHSVEQLEVLLLLYRQSDREWTAEAVNSMLKSSVTSVANRLSDLKRRKFISERSEEGQNLYKFTQDPAIKSDVERLEECYQIFAVRVIERIYDKPNDAFLSFSDSFRISKE